MKAVKLSDERVAFLIVAAMIVVGLGFYLV